MGVDFMTCSLCEETFADCGPYGHCNCERVLCGTCFEDMTKRYGESHEREDWYGVTCAKCDRCALVAPDDSQSLEFALTILGMTKAMLHERMRKAQSCS